MAKIWSNLEVQLGSETTNGWGTEVAPTVKLHGIEDLRVQPGVMREQVKDMRGTIAPGYVTRIREINPSASMEGVVTYEDVPYLLDALCQIRSDTANGATTDATGQTTRSYSAPLYSTDTGDNRSYTMVLSDRVDTYSMLGGVLEEISFAGATGELVRFNSRWFGKSVTTDVHAALSDRVVTPVSGDDVVLYIDPGTDSVGSTPTSDLAFSFNLTLNTNRKPLRHMGDLENNSFYEDRWESELSLMVIANTDSFDLLDASLASTNSFVDRNIRFAFTGDTDRSLTLDFGGTLVSPPEVFEDQDGLMSFEFEFAGQATAGMTTDFFAAESINLTEALV
jgi:hypothetical protein